MNTEPVILVCALTCADHARLAPQATEGARRDPAIPRIVAYADLDITQPFDVERLYARIRAAAREIFAACSLDLGRTRQKHRWVEEATARTIANAHLPALTRYYLSRSGSAYRELLHRDLPTFAHSECSCSLPGLARCSSTAVP